MFTHFCRTFARAYFLHTLLWTPVRGQTPSPYASLSPEPFFPSDSGNFTWPAGESTGTFSEGAKMNISWTTTYPAINLWLITNQSWAQPSSIISNSGAGSELWTISCGQDCTEPFLLRAVTAEPNKDEQEHGGFYSRQFWIHPDKNEDADPSFSRSATSSTETLSPTASSQATSSSTTTTSGLASTPSFESPTSVLSSDDETAIPGPSAAQDRGSDNTTTSLGVGIGVGLGVALLAATVIFFLFWRRSRRLAKADRAKSSHVLDSETPTSSKWLREHGTQNSATAQASSTIVQGKPAQPHVSEIEDNCGMQEMAGGQLEPQELSASSPVNGWH